LLEPVCHCYSSASYIVCEIVLKTVLGYHADNDIFCGPFIEVSVPGRRTNQCRSADSVVCITATRLPVSEMNSRRCGPLTI